MNCAICNTQYDHSIHKPYSLSCSHTFCISCINQLPEAKCPECETLIRAKISNEALLYFIPQSNYDRLKVLTNEILSEIIEITKGVITKSETKLNEYLNQAYSIKNKIRNETSQFIHKVMANEGQLLNEVYELEKYLKESMSMPKESLLWLAELKQSIDENSISEKELTSSIEESSALKQALQDLEARIEEFKENIEFNVYESVCLKDGLIGEMHTNQKKFKILMESALQLQEQNDYEEAIVYINKAIEVCPANIEYKIEYLTTKANILSLMGEQNDCLDLFEQCIKLNPDKEILYINKSAVLFSLTRFDEALDAINKSLELNSNNITSLNLKGKILLNLKKYDEALNQFDKSIELDPGNYKSFALKGTLYKQMKNCREALECYGKALELNPNDQALYHSKAIILKNLDTNDEALDAINEALEFDSKNPEFLNLKGKILFKLEKYDEALNQFDESIKSEPDNDESFMLKGEAYFKMKNYQKALECYNKALELNPECSAYNFLKEEALRHLNKIVKNLNLFFILSKRINN